MACCCGGMLHSNVSKCQRHTSLSVSRTRAGHFFTSRDTSSMHMVFAYNYSNDEEYKELPGGYWWLQQSTDTPEQNVYAIHGEQFVLQRRRLSREEQTRALSVFMSNTDLVPLSQGNSSGNAQIVLVEQAGRDEQVDITDCYDPKSPRRTQRVSFTCNLCLERNLNRPVNPEAWKTGSVFVKCHCGAVHKMKDNLKIFHELHGDVFPPVHQRESFLIQEILDRIKNSDKE